MAKTIRDTILAYPGLADCEDFLDNVVLPGHGFEGTEDRYSKTKAGGCRPLFHGRWSARLYRKQAFYHISPFLV